MGCGGEPSLAWVVRFADPALEERALVVEVALRDGGCEAERPSLFEADLRLDDPAPALEPTRVPPGSYGFWGRARDATCQHFAEGCTRVELPRDGTVAVELAASTEEALCPADACAAGVCEPGAAQEVTAGRAHSCARAWSGSVSCWGRNDEGQLGDGTTDESHAPVAVSGVEHALHVAAGGIEVGWQGHTCAVQAPEGVLCWGFGQFGQLGDGGTTSRPLPAAARALEEAVSVATGAKHTCAVLTGGGLACWGANDRGQLGLDGAATASTPVEVPLTGIVEVSAGQEHTCARSQAGPVWCWGGNADGQLGDDTTSDRASPADPVNIGEYAIAVSAGPHHSCAVGQSGRVYCWGRNAELESGQAGGEGVPIPTLVEGVEDVAEVGAGGGFSCARRNDGHVLCWGSAAFGMLGDGAFEGTRETPGEVLLVDDARDLAVGHNHACVVRPGGEVWCWGRNQYGRLGDGTTEDRAEPTRVVDLAR